MEIKDYATIAVSSLALITAVVSLVLTFRQRTQENLRGVRKSLTETLAELSDVALAFAKLDTEHPEQSDQVVSLRRLYNSRRRYLANHAEFLVAQIPHLATDIDYNLLAQAYQAIGDYDKVQKYWELCVEASPSRVIRAMNLRGQARFMFFQGNPQLGRKRYQESLELDLPDTDNVRRDRADTYAIWAKTELDFGYKDEAERLCQQAKAAAQRVAHAGMRTSMQSYIASLLAPLWEKEAISNPKEA